MIMPLFQVTFLYYIPLFKVTFCHLVPLFLKIILQKYKKVLKKTTP